MFSRTSFCIAALMAIWFVAASLWWIKVAATNPQVCMENQWLEWAQLGLVAAAALFFLFRWARNSSLRRRLILLSLSTLMISILLREFESDDLPVHPIWRFVDSVSGWLTLLIWIGLGWCWGTNLRQLENEPIDRQLGCPFLLTIAAVVVYGLSWPFDRLHWSLGGLKPMLIEELIEFHGGTLMLWASLMPWSLSSERRFLESTPLWNDAPEAIQQVSA
jgi:hypothetical protein